MCSTEPIVGQRLAGKAPLRLQCSYRSDVIFMRKQVCSLEEDHCGSARSTAEDGGISDTRSTQVVLFQLRVIL